MARDKGREEEAHLPLHSHAVSLPSLSTISLSLCLSSHVHAPVCLIMLSSPLSCDTLRSAMLSATRRDFIFTLASGGETRYTHRERECGERRRLATADGEIFEQI